MTQCARRDFFQTPLLEMTQEERFAYSLTMSWSIMARICDAASAKFGPEGKKMVHDCIRDYMREITPKIAASLGIKGKDVESVLKVITWHDTQLWPFMEEQIEMVNDKEGILRITECFLRQRYTPHDCKIGIPYVEGMLEAINPRIKYKASKVLTRGDDCCQLEMRLEET